MSTNISEIDVMRFIREKLNSNIYKIPFKIGTWGMGESEKFMFYRQNLFDNDRFDVREEQNEELYQIEKVSFVPVSFSPLNGEYVNLPEVSMVAYDFTIDFLISLSSPITDLIRFGIESFRNGFIGGIFNHKIKVLDETNINLPPKDEIMTIVSATGSILYSSIETIQGKEYMVATVPITLQVSKDITMGNQLTFEIGYHNGEEIIYEEIKPLNFGLGVGQANNSIQVLRNFNKTYEPNSYEAKAYPQNKAYAFSQAYLLNIEKPIQYLLYEYLIKPKKDISEFYLRQKTKRINNVSGEFYTDDNLTVVRKVLTDNISIDSGSYGEPIIISIGLNPSFEII